MVKREMNICSSDKLRDLARDVVGRVKALIAAGNVRRVTVRTPNDKLVLQMPLTTGVAVLAVLARFAPSLTAAGVLAAMLARARVQITRVENAER